MKNNVRSKDNSKGLRQSEAVFQHINNLGILSDRINLFKDKFNVEGVCSSKNRDLLKTHICLYSM
ncbi:hypothetical protein [Clostridioides difficile]|uniref:hypothetical protein n=1 Tax=Clostridioides difficile TaxID=1496 RepID=UPI001F17FD4F|nr:hypothetical protein [Clostridioides difficile]